jgi:hypothetical protein
VADQDQWRYLEHFGIIDILKISNEAIKTSLMKILHQMMNRMQIFQDLLTLGATKSALEVLYVKSHLVQLQTKMDEYLVWLKFDYLKAKV